MLPLPIVDSDKVVVGNGASLPITHTGSLSHSTSLGSISLLDVLVVPSLTKNLISISKLIADNNCSITFIGSGFTIQDLLTGAVLGTGRCKDGLYVLDRGQKAFLASLQDNNLRASLNVWHARLGHSSFRIVEILNKTGSISINSHVSSSLSRICNSCQLGKSHRLPFALNEKRSSFPLQLIHCDLWGPSPILSTSGFRYYVIFVDDHSRFTWFYPLKHKSDFYDTFLRFQKFVENQFSHSIKAFQCDGGSEFTSLRFKHHLSTCGIEQRFSCPYTPAQNGKAERKHRHITETGLTLLFHAHTPLTMWVEAFSTATYIINRLPTLVLQNASPYEVLYGNSPSYSLFRTFGCLCYPYLRDYVSHKLAPKTTLCVFIGYSSTHKGFRCLNRTTQRVFISRHVIFDETNFPFAGNPQPLLLLYLILCLFLNLVLLTRTCLVSGHLLLLQVLTLDIFHILIRNLLHAFLVRLIKSSLTPLKLQPLCPPLLLPNQSNQVFLLLLLQMPLHQVHHLHQPLYRQILIR
jgi:hypothetical protein